MFEICKKEIKQFFRNKLNLAFVFLAPIILIAVFSLVMKNYIGNKTNNEVISGKTVYYIMNDDGEYAEKFADFSKSVAERFGIKMEETTDYESSVENVKKQEALAVITINEAGCDYYRCSFNETDDAKLFRNVFTEAFGNISETSSKVQTVELEMPAIDSYGYYTLSELGFIIIYISAILAYAVYEEREKRTLNRILLSKVGMGSFLFTKFFMGLFMAVLQIASAYIFSTFVLDVDWGKKTFLIILVYLSLGIFSASFGISVAMTVRKREGIDNIVMLVAILCGYMGGAFVPASVLESKNIIRHIIKIDPLYWCNKAVISLYGGEVNSDIAVSVCLSLGLATVLSTVCVCIYNSRRAKEGNLC